MSRRSLLSSRKPSKRHSYRCTRSSGLLRTSDARTIRLSKIRISHAEDASLNTGRGKKIVGVALKRFDLGLRRDVP